MRARVADVITSLVLLALAHTIYVTSAGFRTFSRSDVGPAFFPRLVALALLVLAVLLAFSAAKSLWEGWRSRPARRVVPDDAASLHPTRLERVWLALAVAALAAYPWAIARSGFIATTIFLNVVLMRAVGERRWWMTALVSVVVGFATYAVFYYGLNMPLPEGSLFGQG